MKSDYFRHIYASIILFSWSSSATATPCSDGELRLADGDESQLYGRVEICNSGIWGTVCSSGTSINTIAEVVCRNLNIEYHDARSLLNYRGGTGPIVKAGVKCGKHQNLLTDCHSEEVGIHESDCDHSSDVGVMCAPECTENDVKLVNNMVLVCHNTFWTSLCQESLTLSNGQVICRQLGYSDRGSLRDFWPYNQESFDFFSTMKTCTGNEESFTNCTSGPELEDCSFSGVLYCTDKENECDEVDAIRLVGDPKTSSAGRVEVCVDGLWAIVCNEYWSISHANVVCRQLGHNGTSYLLSDYGDFSDRYFLLPYERECNGNETQLKYCVQRGNSRYTASCAPGIENAAILCTNSTCENGEVQLVGRDTLMEGRVKVCYNGTWHSVCADGWSQNDVTVLCSSFGVPLDMVSVVNNITRDLDPVLPYVFQCTGNESTLTTCTMTTYDSGSCLITGGALCQAPCLSQSNANCDLCGDEDTCFAIEGSSCNCNPNCYKNGMCCSDWPYLKDCSNEVRCKEGDVRLVGAANASSGLLEVCANGHWGRVCDFREEWRRSKNAEVVCRQLNLSTSGARTIADELFDSVSSNPVLLDNVHCRGGEMALLDCTHGNIGTHLCDRAFGATEPHKVAVQCQDDCIEGDVRLIDGTHASNGRVEVCKNGIWGAICSKSWSLNNARVLCLTLNYTTTGDVSSTDVFGPGPPVLSSVFQCGGDETNLEECAQIVNKNFNSQTCTSAGTICSRDNDNEGECEEKREPEDIVDKLGSCEVYQGDNSVCDRIYQEGIDYIYIPKVFESQENIALILEGHIPSTIQLTDRPCRDKLFQIICRYYLSPCGNQDYQYSPTSVCPTDCSMMESECSLDWSVLEQRLADYTFIQCSDPKSLLFPIPSCCEPISRSTTIEPVETSVQPRPPIANSSNNDGLTIGLSITFTIVIIITCVTILLYCCYRKWIFFKKAQRLQSDIFSRPGTSTQDFVIHSGRDKNEYTDSQSKSHGHGGDMSGMTTTTRLNSIHLRELKRGAFIMKYEDLKHLECIGQGEFGVVYRAKLVNSVGASQIVAVKTLKGMFDQIEIGKFVEESLKMSRFKHSHVMGLIGVCLDGGPAPYIVMPYMANGSLLDYLKKERKQLVFPDNSEHDLDQVQEVRKRLMVMCSQIANGMEYLAKEKYIHRDLAARNCMIDSHFLIKIADFGLSEDVFLRNYFRDGLEGEGGKLPVKWMAPESLSDGHFSEKSDVWSYGVTMWEIFSGGKAPYAGTDPLTLVQRLEDGVRLPKPNNAACTEQIHRVMKRCWEFDPVNRPTFRQLHLHNTRHIERIAGYLEMGYNPFAVKKTSIGSADERESKMFGSVNGKMFGSVNEKESKMFGSANERESKAFSDVSESSMY